MPNPGKVALPEANAEFPAHVFAKAFTAPIAVVEGRIGQG